MHLLTTFYTFLQAVSFYVTFSYSTLIRQDILPDMALKGKLDQSVIVYS